MLKHQFAMDHLDLYLAIYEINDVSIPATSVLFICSVWQNVKDKKKFFHADHT